MQETDVGGFVCRGRFRIRSLPAEDTIHEPSVVAAATNAAVAMAVDPTNAATPDEGIPPENTTEGHSAALAELEDPVAVSRTTAVSTERTMILPAKSVPTTNVSTAAVVAGAHDPRTPEDRRVETLPKASEADDADLAITNDSANEQQPSRKTTARHAANVQCGIEESSQGTAMPFRTSLVRPCPHDHRLREGHGLGLQLTMPAHRCMHTIDHTSKSMAGGNA